MIDMCIDFIMLIFLQTALLVRWLEGMREWAMSKDEALALVAAMQSQLESLSTSLALLRSHIQDMDRPQPVEPPPEAERLIADFDVEAPERTAPCTAQFRDRSRGAVTSWWWNFGNGNTSRERNPTFNYRTGGTKDVTLAVANEKVTRVRNRPGRP
jgi:hypothetical protein